MKNLIKRVLAFLLCMCTLFGTFVMAPTSASAAENKKSITFIWGTQNDTYYCITKDKAPLRNSASDSGSIVTKLDKGDFVKVIGTVRTWKTTLWLKVSYVFEGKVRTGYLYSGNAKKYNVNINSLRQYAEDLYDECDIYNKWGITKAQAMDLANTASSKTAVGNSLAKALKAKLDKNVGKSMNVSSYKTTTKYTYTDSNGILRKNWGSYVKTGGCTWYAFNRFLEINGTGIMFRGAGGGNANQWDERINTAHFSKISTKKLSNKTFNAVAVDNQGSSGYGHVAYIELVLDGYVYYSHGWYSGGKFSSRLEKKSLKDFQSTFETVLLPNSVCRMP